MKLIFATANAHKVGEVQQLLGSAFDISTPAVWGVHDDIPETGHTLQENALQKARFIWEQFQQPCFGDDTGLEVDVLNGAPGVYSARYAGAGKRAADNVRLLLDKMQDATCRTARFRCVVALIIDGKEYFFEGKVEGEILRVKQGIQGFGYDSVFCPEGYNCSFAEMSLDAKNRISHRGQAIRQLGDFLRNNAYGSGVR